MKKITLLFSCFVLYVNANSISNYPLELNSDKKKIENSADIPSEMERNYDNLLNEWIINKSNKNNCTYTNSDKIFCSDSVYINRLYHLPSTMELAYNDVVKKFIELYAGRRQGQVSYMLALGEYYFPLFEQALEKEGLPLELKYLPVIESALNPFAKSRVGASGLWQFMPATGKIYSLEINSLVDERFDPQKATSAAAKYLKDMYEIYGDWNLVIAAYNCGPGNVNKAIKRSGDKKDYWDIYPYLPKETRGYVPAFIAATYIMNFYQEHNICPAEVSMPLLVDTINVNKMLHFEQVSEMLNVPIQEIRLLNPQYKSDIVPGGNKTYSLKLPINNITSFISKEDAIYAYKADELFTHKKVRNVAYVDRDRRTHKVKKGETLGAIASKYGVSLNQLKKLNGLKSNNLNIGQNLIVSNAPRPQNNTHSIPTNNLPLKKNEDVELVIQDGVLKRRIKVTTESTNYYTVVKGDTWNALAKKTGASIANIKRWNNIKGNNIIAGKQIKIISTITSSQYEDLEKPETININKQALVDVISNYVESINSEKENFTFSILENEDSIDFQQNQTDEDITANLNKKTDDIIIHQLIYGETLSQIAKKYNVTIDELKKWNHLNKNRESNPSTIIIKKKKNTENNSSQIV